MVLLKNRLLAWAQSKTVQEVPQKENGLCVGITCLPMHAPWRSGSGEGNCVQSSFPFHLIGLVFLDLGSRHTDQPLISCSWQLRWCLLFIVQCRMDHVTRHICTHCLGMWENTQEDTDWYRRVVNKCLPKAATEPLLAVLTTHTPSFSPWPARLPFVSSIFCRVVIVERKGVSFRVAVMVMHCVSTEQKPEDPQPPFTISIAGRSSPPGQVLNTIYDILCSIYKVSSCSSVLVITPLWGGKCNWTHFTTEKVRPREIGVTLGFRERNHSGARVYFHSKILWCCRKAMTKD